MYKEKHIESDLNGNCPVVVIENRLLISTSTELYLFDPSVPKKEIIYKGAIWYFKLVFDEEVFYQIDNGGPLYAYNLNTGSSKRFKGAFYLWNSKNSSDVLLIIEEKLGVNYFMKIDRALNIAGLENLLVIPQLILPNKRCILWGPKPSCVSYEDGKEEWHINPKELLNVEDARQSGNIVSNILYHSNKIFIFLESVITNKYATFCLDETNGTIIKKIENISVPYYLSGDKIFNAYYYSTTILNIETFSVTKINLEDILRSEKLVLNQNTSVLTNEGLLYFIDGLSIGSNRFGIIDLNKKELLWNSKIKIKSRYKVIQSIQLSGDNLYVHADDNTLHIFQK